MSKDDDVLDLNPEDLDAEQREPEPPGPGGLPAVPGEPGLAADRDDDVLDLDLADLPPDVAPAKPLPPVGQALTGPVESLPSDELWAGGKKKSGVETVVTATLNVLPLAVAGGLGGLLAWGILEPFTHDDATVSSLGEVLRDMALFGAGMGGCIAMAIGAVEGVSAANLRRALEGAGLGLLIGVVGGAFGGVFGQLLYGSLGGGSTQIPILFQIAVRTIGWALIGAFIGLAPGVLTRSVRKITNGLLGGLLGGSIGGFLFDPIGLIFGGGEISRMLALSMLGAVAGAAIGLIEEMRKEAWLVITGGPLAGKQFILYNEVTTIGRSPKADIMLAKEPAAIALHCRITRSGQQLTLEDLSGGATLVNGRSVPRATLRNGSVITIGDTQLSYYERATSAEPGPERLG